MANGFQGISIVIAGDSEFISPKYGMSGISLAYENRQYIANKYGISGISIAIESNEKPTKVIRK